MKTSRKKIAGGVRWSTAHMIVRGVLQLLQLVILARYLSPNDFGLISILLVVYALSRAFSDVGISQGIIHKKNLNENQLSSLFWINVILGIIVFLCACLLSSHIGNFYDNNELGTLIVISSIAFLVVPFGMQYRMLLQKSLDFKTTSISDIISGIIGFICTITMVTQGYGVYSVVIGNLINICSAALILYVQGGKYYRPKFYLRISEIKDVLSYGFYNFASKITNQLGSEIDSLIVGKLLGVDILGFYSIAKKVVRQPSQFVEPVMTKISFPVMAKMQEDRSALSKSYMHLQNIVCSLNTPVYILMFFMSESIVRIFLGEKWLAASEIVKIFCVWGIFRSMTLPSRPLILATGQLRSRFYRSLFFVFIVSLSIYFSSRFGLVGVSWAMALVATIGFFVNWYVFPRVLAAISLYDLLRSSCRSFFISVACALTILIFIFIPIENQTVSFVMCVSSFTAAYIFAISIFNKPFYADILAIIGKGSEQSLNK